ncbi:hypothetical protein [Streptomyces acidiscabies]|uniref:Uncharacterized protein n=1 Tax=Streptomyces acidiscabies TaxID=42234 RepID=A0AAP6B953_9ACTN|nr:hypothetical protein [Streptomyces acidiscabies]MDX2960477.1 hypothetical protein [Streptomyces acidiscabies]MDX3017763.1 hypothetical protein [Streptomyces acidiscabies]MDX3794308.1 hypothetical protein [Streptomyces acidiscabies]
MFLAVADDLAQLELRVRLLLAEELDDLPHGPQHRRRFLVVDAVLVRLHPVAAL